MYELYKVILSLIITVWYPLPGNKVECMRCPTFHTSFFPVIQVQCPGISSALFLFGIFSVNTLLTPFIVRYYIRDLGCTYCFLVDRLSDWLKDSLCQGWGEGMRRGLSCAGDGLLFIIKINKNNNKNYPIGENLDSWQGKARQDQHRTPEQMMMNWHRTSSGIFMVIWQTNEKGALPPPTDLECGVYMDLKKIIKILIYGSCVFQVFK